MKITRIEFESTGLCHFFSNGGEIISSFPTVYESAFNRQYGTPLSKDDAFIFIGNWYTGLYCYDISSGKLSWKKGPGRVRRIIPTVDYLIVEMCGRGIYQRDIRTGELVKEIKMSSIECLFQISESEEFAGPKRGNFFIFTIPDLYQKQEIKGSILNPNDCLSHIILNCRKTSRYLIINGFEEYPNKNYRIKGVKYFEHRLPISSEKTSSDSEQYIGQENFIS